MGAHVPYQLMRRCNKATMIDPCLIPSPVQAVHMYRLNSGRITDPDDFSDPLFNDPVKIELRFQSFAKRFPSFNAIFHSIVNETTPRVFVDALLFFINLTFRLYHS